jgi:hypothetical protein
MPNCQCCKAEIHAYDSSCPNCRALTYDPQSKLPYGFPQKWRVRFDMIEKAGGAALSKLDQVTDRELARIRFNFWAFFFGPLFYLAKGMWQKAVVRWLPGGAAMFLLNIIATPPEALALFSLIISISTGVWCARRANVDYYSKIVLRDNDW